MFQLDGSRHDAMRFLMLIPSYRSNSLIDGCILGWDKALYQHLAVREAGVIGVPDAALGERVQAYVALKDGTSVSEEELKQFLAGRMAAYKVPEKIACPICRRG